MATEQQSVLVVGAGINGLMSAFMLARRDARVMVCDTGDIPNPYNASYDDHRLIHPWQANSGTGHCPESLRALDMWSGILQEIACDGFEKTGVFVANPQGLGEADIAVGEEKSRHLLPGSDRYSNRLMFPKFGVMMASEIVNALIVWLRDEGVRFLPRTRVLVLDEDRGQVTLEGKDSQRFDAIVMAMGWGLAPFARQFKLSIVRPWRCYVVYAPEDTKGLPRMAWTGFSGRDMWGMPPLRGLAAKFGWGGLSHPDNVPRRTDQDVRDLMAEAYSRIDPAYEYLRDGVVASKTWTEIVSDTRVRRKGRCVIVTSDNGTGFKYAPIVGDIASRLCCFQNTI